MEQVEIVGIAGGSGSGKSTLARAVVAHEPRAAVLEIDSYYRDLSHLSLDQRHAVNFDHPDAIDWELLESHLEALRSGRSIERPVYDFSTHTRLSAPSPFGGNRFIVLEGILALYPETLRRLYSLAIFVEAPRDLRVTRRVHRDVQDRGRTAASVLRQVADTVEPMYAEFVEPSRRHADFIADGRADLDLTVARLFGALAA